ncbi:MAG: hypothetical protein JNJ45_03085 [Chthonomonas sp.]|nr:hypothetical protein [Chthonomonas sp.]
MGRWKNFNLWRGHLPHWRADDVVYYVTFNSRRPLTDDELKILYFRLMKLTSKGFDLIIVCALPEATEMMFRFPEGGEFSDALEKTKAKAMREILKKSGERYPPVSGESYDRIVRDQAEFEERWETIFESCAPIEEETGGDYDWFWCVEDGSSAFGNTSSEESSACP